LNIKEYISSGVLELYSAGALSESESKEVEEIIKKYPEAKSEFEKLQKTIYLVGSKNLKAPSSKVKESLLNKVRESNSSKSNIQTLRSITTYEKPSGNYRYLMAASIAFLLLSLGTNFFLLTKLKDAKTEIAVLSEQKKIVVQEYEAVNRRLTKASQDMEIIKDRSYKMADLKGLEKSPNSNAIAFWNPETKKVYVEVMNLPVPPSDKQYQLWALSNGKPVDAGVMDVDPSDKSLHEMKSMDDAQAFAITLEPKGGSSSPTMDQMYVMGKI
jgi:anti-sigma-K factor RskA